MANHHVISNYSQNHYGAVKVEDDNYAVSTIPLPFIQLTDNLYNAEL